MFDNWGASDAATIILELLARNLVELQAQRRLIPV